MITFYIDGQLLRSTSSVVGISGYFIGNNDGHLNTISYKSHEYKDLLEYGCKFIEHSRRGFCIPDPNTLPFVWNGLEWVIRAVII